MKNSILLIATGLILLTGCSKEESFETTPEQIIDLVYVLEQNGNTSTFRTITLEGANLTLTTEDEGYGETYGLYAPNTRDQRLLSWSGFTDETGTYGTAEYHFSLPAYTLHFVMQAECIVVEGNKAMYGGIVTEVIERSGNAPEIAVNWRLYFQVSDIEDSPNRGFDQISNTMIFASPRSPSLCSAYPPGHRIWSSQGFQDVREPGFVEVSEVPE
jgi:hypothetical protein